jgi:hypothetical protein
MHLEPHVLFNVVTTGDSAAADAFRSHLNVSASPPGEIEWRTGEHADVIADNDEVR